MEKFMKNKGLTLLAMLVIAGVVVSVIFLMRLPGQLSPPANLFEKSLVSNEVLPLDTTVVSPHGVPILVRTAQTQEQRRLGLSYFKDLPDGQGMLFIFPQIDPYSFWMKDMNFSIDIVWIDEKGVIVDRVIAASPASYPENFTPQAPAQFVLEIPANTANRDGFVIGGRVKIQNNK